MQKKKGRIGKTCRPLPFAVELPADEEFRVDSDEHAMKGKAFIT
jgi:hypothetical protein